MLDWPRQLFAVHWPCKRLAPPPSRGLILRTGFWAQIPAQKLGPRAPHPTESDLQYEVMVETDEGMQAYPVDLQPLLMKSYWDGARSIEVAVMMESGRHAGQTHTYSVWWVGGNEGMQFNTVRSDAKARRVSIITKKVGELHWQQKWGSSAPAASSWSGGW